MSNNDAAKRVFLLQGGYEVYQKLPSVFEDVICSDGGTYSINLLELFFNYLLAMILDIGYAYDSGFRALNSANIPRMSPSASPSKRRMTVLKPILSTTCFLKAIFPSATSQL